MSFECPHLFHSLPGAVGPSNKDFWALLHQMWFTPYSRSTKYETKDSSGFEHVFIGETRGEKVLGMHNWIRFFLEECYNMEQLNYHGYVAVTEVRIPLHSKSVFSNNLSLTAGRSGPTVFLARTSQKHWFIFPGQQSGI
jgi:hypothetical protein